MARHIRTHTKEKPFKCNWAGCSFASAQSEHLTIHIRSHTGAKPHTCDVDGCAYSAARGWLVTRHKQQVHGVGRGPCLAGILPWDANANAKVPRTGVLNNDGSGDGCNEKVATTGVLVAVATATATTAVGQCGDGERAACATLAFGKM